nr:MAG: hypothetical protein DiTV3a_F11ORF4 [Diabrotica toursvirus 3a]
MSVFLQEKSNIVCETVFTKFYGTAVLCPIIKKGDLSPLFRVLSKNPNVKLVNNLHLRICDIFSQTLYSFGGDSCKVLEKWSNETKHIIKPYEFLPSEAIMDIHYAAKEIVDTKFPQNFNISLKLQLKIKNDKIILTFDITPEHKSIIKDIIKELTELYGIEHKKVINYIVIGYLKGPINLPSDIQTLVPRKIVVEHPNVYHYSDVDSYRLFTHGMY